MIIQKNVLIQVDLNDEQGFNNDCIIRSSSSIPANLKAENSALRIKNEKVDTPYPISQFWVLRLGRKEEEMRTKKDLDYLQRCDFECLQIDDAKLSRCHCDILNDNGILRINDCISMNVTYRRLHNTENCNLNKEIVFYFMNVKFRVDSFYKFSNNSKTLYMKINVADDPEVYINISNDECSSVPVFLSHKSKNKEVAEIFITILQNCKDDFSKLDDQNFPYIIFQNGLFLLIAENVSSRSETLIKLNPYAETVNSSSFIDFYIGDKFNLGGETFISLELLCEGRCGNTYNYITNCYHHFCMDCCNKLSKNRYCLCGEALTDFIERDG